MDFIRKQQIFFYAVFSVLAIIGLVLLFIPTPNATHYDRAVTELKDLLTVPESLMIEEACYDDTKVILTFKAQDSFGNYGASLRGVYYFDGPWEGDVDIYQSGDAGYPVFVCSSSYTRYSNWMINDKINPISVMGFALLFVGGTGSGVTFALTQTKPKAPTSKTVKPTFHSSEAIYAELEKVKALYDKEILTKDEYDSQKQLLIKKLNREDNE